MTALHRRPTRRGEPCITGVQTAQACVDWVEWTQRRLTVESILGRFDGPGQWHQLPKGMHGYSVQWRRGDVVVLCEGRPEMGVHIQLSGGACRQLERERLVQDWQGFLSGLREMDARFTRVDVALDDRAGRLDLDEILRCMEGGLVVSRLKYGEARPRHNLADGALKAQQIVFGAATSDIQIRFYDKALQSGEGGPWVRVEVQARRSRAETLADGVIHNGAGVVAGVLRHSVDFKVRGRHSQRERWASADWWREFLGEGERVRLTLSSDPPLSKGYQWLWQQAAPTLARLYQEAGLEAVLALIEHGEARLEGAGQRGGARRSMGGEKESLPAGPNSV